MHPKRDLWKDVEKTEVDDTKVFQKFTLLLADELSATVLETLRFLPYPKATTCVLAKVTFP
jgi:hypothetical protein